MPSTATLPYDRCREIACPFLASGSMSPERQCHVSFGNQQSTVRDRLGDKAQPQSQQGQKAQHWYRNAQFHTCEPGLAIRPLLLWLEAQRTYIAVIQHQVLRRRRSVKCSCGREFTRVILRYQSSHAYSPAVWHNSFLALAQLAEAYFERSAMLPAQAELLRRVAAGVTVIPFFESSCTASWHKPHLARQTARLQPARSVAQQPVITPGHGRLANDQGTRDKKLRRSRARQFSVERLG